MSERFESYLGDLLQRRLGHGGPWPREVHRHVTRMAQAAGCDALTWLRGVERRPDDWAALLGAATVGHTAFFRHPEHYVRLAETALELARSREVIRVWSVGCSTGEEPWSIAICLERLGLEFCVLATDINPAAVEKARRGSYAARDTRGLPGYEGERAFDAPAQLRSRVQFEVMAVGTPSPWQSVVRCFEVIFCRNMLIYFSPRAAQQALAHLADHVAEGGALVVSPVEALSGLPASFVRRGPLGWLERSSASVVPHEAREHRAEVGDPARGSVPSPTRHAVDGMLDQVAACLRTSQLDSAEALLHEVLEKRDDALGWFLLGEVCLRRGEPTQARVAFERAVRAQHAPADVDLTTIRRAAARRAQMSRRNERE